MVFVRAWNETTPADTLVANLYAEHLRFLKVDIRERMAAFGAGLKSARETPDAVFGNASTGVMFLAEDEGKFYRWNGVSWSAVSCEHQQANQTFVDVNTANTDGVVVTVGSAIIDAVNVYAVDFFSSVSRLSGTTAVQWKLRVGTALDLVDLVPAAYPALFNTRFVIGGPSATLTTNNVFGYTTVNGALVAVHQGLSLDVSVNWQARLRSSTVPFSGDSFRVHQTFVRVTR